MRERIIVLSFTPQTLLAVLLLAAAPAVWGNSPPDVSLSGNLPGLTLREGDSIRLSATAFDAEGPVLKVEFYQDGLLLGEDAVPPYQQWWSNAVLGTHALMAVAVDSQLARGTSAVVMVPVELATNLNLTWWPSSSQAGEWNTTTPWWYYNGRQHLFRDGDSVAFNGFLPTNFIGMDSVPQPVAPAAISISGQCTFYGGDIRAGSLTVHPGASVTFSNYPGSLSFPGGTFIRDSTSGGLTVNAAAVPSGGAFHFGTGPIAIGGIFHLQPGSNRWVTVENDFHVTNQPGYARIQINQGAYPGAVGRFSGSLTLGSELNFVPNGPPSAPGTDLSPHEWAGPIILEPATPIPPRIGVQFSYKGLLISGDIRNGGGSRIPSLPLRLYADGYNGLRLSGNNTYTNGTEIQYASGVGPGVEVAPLSSLGSGDVRVYGVLRLMGSRNIHSNASVEILGRVTLDAGVKVRLRSLSFGGMTYTNGIFRATTPGAMPYLRSNGSFRLPAVNLPPTVSLTAPSNAASFPAGGTITLVASPSDIDSLIQQVEFRLNGSLLAVRTNAPYQVQLQSIPVGTYVVQAVVYDDDGAQAVSSEVGFSVQPRIERIEIAGPDAAALEFFSIAGQDITLQATDGLETPDWTNVMVFPADNQARLLRVTNEVPAGTRQRHYRLRVP